MTTWQEAMEDIYTEAYVEGHFAEDDLQSLKDHFKIERMRAHVKMLADKLGCRIDYFNKLHGMMFVEFGYIEAPKINDQIDYMVCLHELGHFALGHTQGRPPFSDKKFYFDNGVLKSEAQAWDWAIDQCKEKLTVDTLWFMWDKCLSTYYYEAERSEDHPFRLMNGDRHYVEFIWDKPDEYFYSVVNKMIPGLKL